jgi:hypothetical protein
MRVWLLARQVIKIGYIRLLVIAVLRLVVRGGFLAATRGLARNK